MPKPYSIDAILGQPDSHTVAHEMMKALDAMDKVECGSEYHFWCAYDFRRKVGWDGLAQWFSNAAAMPLRDAYAGLVAVGATRHAEMLKEAMNVFPGGEPSDELEEYLATAENLTREQKTALNNLDDEVYNLDKSLYEILHKFLIDHVQDFR